MGTGVGRESMGTRGKEYGGKGVGGRWIGKMCITHNFLSQTAIFLNCLQCFSLKPLI